MAQRIESSAPPRQHHWVRWTLEDVAVIVDPFTGDPSVEALPYSAVGEQVACHGCGESLTASSVVTACTGEE